jgi:hypothetical protein
MGSWGDIPEGMYRRKTPSGSSPATTVVTPFARVGQLVITEARRGTRIETIRREDLGIRIGCTWASFDAVRDMYMEVLRYEQERQREQERNRNGPSDQ